MKSAEKKKSHNNNLAVGNDILQVFCCNLQLSLIARQFVRGNCFYMQRCKKKNIVLLFLECYHVQFCRWHRRFVASYEKNYLYCVKGVALRLFNLVWRSRNARRMFQPITAMTISANQVQSCHRDNRLHFSRL